MTIFNVSNVTQLENALTSAHGGDTVELAAGAYSGLGTLSGLNYASDVTITSANASNQAVITPFYLSNSSNLTFSNITFNAAGSTDPYANRVISSTGVSFDHDTFQGNLTGAVSSESMDGLGFFSSSNVSVTNSDFNHLADGIANIDTNGGVFSDNSFHEIRTDGIDNSSSGNLQILNNVFTDFSPAASDHPDAIQVWGTTSDPSHDITVSGNLYVRGAGSPIQGVFSNDNPGEVNNLTITHNTIIGGLYNGIAVMGASGVTVQSNTIEAYSASQDSWIRLQNDSGLNETGNASYEYLVSSNTGVTQSGNTTLSTLASSDGGSALVTQWVANHAGWTGTLPASVAAIGGTPAGGSTGGGSTGGGSTGGGSTGGGSTGGGSTGGGSTGGGSTGGGSTGGGSTGSGSGSHGGGTTYNVSTVAQLEQALKSAHGGDTIKLAAGAYSGLGELSGLHYASDVTVTSADPAHQAVITPFYLESSSNLSFSDITFNAAGSTDPYAYRVYNSSGISFDSDTFHGNMTGAVTSEPMDGLAFFSSSNVSVTNSDFNHLSDGVANISTTGGVFSDNSFHQLASDGIDVSSSTNIQVTNNAFTDFSPASGAHPDAIQVWGTTSAPSQNVTISGNLVERGSGGAIQGIFSNDNPGEVSNLTISHNTIIGGMYNGIAVMGASNVTVQSNTVEAYSASQDSWIRLQNINGLHETGNASYEYLVSNNTGVTQSGNTTDSQLSHTDGGQSLVNQWVSSHPDFHGFY